MRIGVGDWWKECEGSRGWRCLAASVLVAVRVTLRGEGERERNEALESRVDTSVHEFPS